MVIARMMETHLRAFYARSGVPDVLTAGNHAVSYMSVLEPCVHILRRRCDERFGLTLVLEALTAEDGASLRRLERNGRFDSAFGAGGASLGATDSGSNRA